MHRLTAHGCLHHLHPRVCGEHAAVMGDGSSAAGSSPRVRGTYDRRAYPPKQVRFIPACAGNIYNLNQQLTNEPVHPRVCGEHKPVRAAAIYRSGSSPRVRGTSERAEIDDLEIRFIPACAGNIGSSVFVLAGLAGSSPRVRGTFIPADHNRPLRRFIPACAGNIGRRVASQRICAVHPRVCGEHGARCAGRRFNGGSSPRVRGT